MARRYCIYPASDSYFCVNKYVRNYDMMKLTDFYYDLPQELIAQDPLLKRSESRLMVLDRKDNTIEHKHFYDV